MNAADLQQNNIRLHDLTHGVWMGGQLDYQDGERQLRFYPSRPLAYATDYELTIAAGIRSHTGPALAASFVSRFRTQNDPFGPRPTAVQPQNHGLEVPIQAEAIVLWDRALNPATVNPSSVLMKHQNGISIPGTVSHDNSTRTTRFRPSAPLSPDSFYMVTLKSAIADSLGIPMVSDFTWNFKTDSTTWTGARFTDAYQEEVADDNADGLWERLLVRVGVYIPSAGSWILHGGLADSLGIELANTSVQANLTAGVHFLTLEFPANSLRNAGRNGSYQLIHLVLTKSDDFNSLITKSPDYWTGSYPAGLFQRSFSFGGLPDIHLLPGQSRLQAFNVRNYVQHPTKTGSQLSYRVSSLSDVQAGVTLDKNGFISITPDLGWKGSAQVTVQAVDGSLTAQDTFEVRVGLHLAHLPLLIRSGQPPPQQPRLEWITLFFDNFEGSDFLWQKRTIIWGPSFIDIFWGPRNCLAYSGNKSVWAIGGGSVGSAFTCGAVYPTDIETWMMLPSTNFYMRYLSAAQFRFKAYTQLGAGDQLCIQVCFEPCSITSTNFYRTCVSGNSGGWRDVIMNMDEVPGLGNVLGQDRIAKFTIAFLSDSSGTAPIGAYVDDVEYRVCPVGLQQYCPK